MPRQPVRRVSDPTPLRPVAAPVDTYVRPPDPPPATPLRDLAQGLASLENGLGAFLSKRNQEADARDKLRARQAFIKNNSEGYAEGVRRGLIPAHESPVFVSEYKRAEGDLAGRQLQQKFRAEYQTWAGRNGADAGQFTTFLSDFLAKNVGDLDPDVFTGMQPHIDQLADTAYGSYSDDIAKSTYQGSVSTHGAIASETLQGASDRGLSSPTGMDLDSTWSDLMAEREKALSSGVLEKDFDDNLVKTIIAKSIELGDPSMLGLLDKAVTGADHALSTYPEYAGQKQSAIEKLEDAARTRAADQWREQERADKQRKESIMRGVTKMLAKDPNADIPEQVLSELEKYDPQARATVLEVRKKLLEGGAVEDPREILELGEVVRNGGTEEDINRAVRDGRIRNRETYNSMLDRLEKYRKALSEGSGILTDQSAKRIAAAIKDRTTPPTVFDPFGTRGLSNEGLEATQDFEGALMEWEAANPNATFIERQKAINEIGTAILGRIDKDTQTFDSAADRLQREQEQQRQYNASEDERRAQQEDFARKQEGGLIPSQDGQSRSLSGWTGEQAPDLKSLPQEDQDYINNESKRLGVDPEKYKMQLWKTIKELISGGSGENSLPGGSAGNDRIPQDTQLAVDTILDGVTRSQAGTSAVKSSDPKVRTVAPILDLLGKSEGTDKGRGYNETLGYGAYTGGNVDLVNMTLGQIDRLQTSMLKNPKNKLRSSALGRYQIIRTTLRTLKKKLGLNDDLKFTPELQDYLAYELLKGRGLEQWQSGKLSDKQFMDNLSKEWASLPNALGVGAYAGQKASVKNAAVLEALRSIRSVAA